jgi:RHS repeat-associated protein
VKFHSTITINFAITDHASTTLSTGLGSIDAICDENGDVVERYSYDAWGNRRHQENWFLSDTRTNFITNRGFTGHEHLDVFGLINANARMYEPATGRFLTPDPYIQAPDFSQNYNRYAYALNNPLVYTDPSGEFIWMPIIIGAAIGTYMGGTLANNDYNPANWDYSSGRTWGYMAGGAIVGAASGYIGGAVATSGMPMANTAGIASASFVNSVGTHIYTGGQTDVSISFGVASYNFDNNEWGYLGKRGNSALENIGYGFGALANLGDAFSLFSGGGQNVKVNSASTKDGNEWWGHSSITDENGSSLVSVGPDGQVQKAASLSETWRNSIKGADTDWSTYLGKKGTWSVEMNNVSTTAISKYASGVSRWDLLLNSCVGHTSRALWTAGIPNVYAFHPHMLNLQLAIRQIGIYSSPYLYQMR